MNDDFVLLSRIAKSCIFMFSYARFAVNMPPNTTQFVFRALRVFIFKTPITCIPFIEVT